VKEAYLKRLHTYDASDMTFWKRQNFRDSKKISGFQRFRGREKGMNRWHTGDLYDTETIL